MQKKRPIVFLACVLCCGIIFSDATAITPPGHLQPLGSHQSPLNVDVQDNQLGPLEFFDNYVKPSRPVLLKGAAKTFPSFNLLNSDAYLKYVINRQLLFCG